MTLERSNLRLWAVPASSRHLGPHTNSDEIGRSDARPAA